MVIIYRLGVIQRCLLNLRLVIRFSGFLNNAGGGKKDNEVV